MDQHTVMVRRRVAAAVAVVLLIIIVLVINGCLKSQKKESLENYNRDVGQLASRSDSQVSSPLFQTLTGAAAKSAPEVDEKVNQLRIQAQEIVSEASRLNVPGEMAGAQRALLMALDMRLEGMSKLATLVPTALGSARKEAAAKIAGTMEVFLASDVIYSQRVAPLIQQTLHANGIRASTAATRFIPNVGWLETSTALSRITGQPASSSNTGIAPGTHGSALIGTAVGANALEAEPALNHISGGSTPTFTVTVENTGSNQETNVKVDVTVVAAGAQRKASHVINSTSPGQKLNVEIPIEKVPLGVASKVQVEVEPVPGETNAENNKSTYLAIFQ